jgi:hypothetical protein
MTVLMRLYENNTTVGNDICGAAHGDEEMTRRVTSRYFHQVWNRIEQACRRAKLRHHPGSEFSEREAIVWMALQDCLGLFAGFPPPLLGWCERSEQPTMHPPSGGGMVCSYRGPIPCGAG